MKNRIVVTYEGDYIQVLSDGKKNYQFANKLWTEVVKSCKENNCYRVLGIAQTSKPVSSDEAYHHKDLFKDVGIDASYRIAWVELEKSAFNTAYFAVNVLLSNGFDVRLYKQVSEAVLWLTNDSQK